MTAPTLTLVTGSTGTVGSAIVAELLAGGRTVRCLVRDPSRLAARPGVELFKGDLTDQASIRAALAGVSHVFHAGGIPEQWVADPSVFMRINRDGTKAMVDAALAEGVSRFVYTSTQDIFDLTANPFDETMPGREPLLSDYERSKQAADLVVETAVEKGLPACFLHPAAVFGPGADKVVGLTGLLDRLLKSEVPALLRGGLPVVFNRDLAKAHLLAEEKAAPGAHYILFDSYQTLQDIARAVEAVAPAVKRPATMPDWVADLIAGVGGMLAGITGKRPLVSHGELGVLRRTGRPISAKARTELGWTTTDFAAGVAETIAWLKERN
ncbi:NAD-dependent epimerase/dehydratase family protein [Parasphingorhabdus sp.]|uniref:NAD-dependent epimerase/dehydratase family protein n=1 Tax=Parasphingorhabdus sp. TaxID=2709688 RepID=UPI0035939584